MQIQNNPNKKFNPLGIAFFVVYILFMINPIFAVIGVIGGIIYIKNNKNTSSFLKKYLEAISKAGLNTPGGPSTSNITKIIEAGLTNNNSEDVGGTTLSKNNDNIIDFLPAEISPSFSNTTRLQKRKKYLHIALNNSLEDAEEIISRLPVSDRILIEVGTPMIKRYGVDAIYQIKNMTAAGTYIVADNKCADLASREVEMMANAGANASTCLGVAPIETINSFIEECQKYNIDSMIDMMNVEDSLAVLKKLKKLPSVVILHRGVDETETTKGKQIPLYQIKQIKGNYNLIVAVAGGDTIKEIQSALFNDADIVVVWKNFYQANSDTAELANDFLKEIK